MKIKAEAPKDNKLSALKPAVPDKTNEQTARISGNGKIPAPNLTSTRNAQNEELDSMVLNLLEKAIAGADQWQVRQEFEKESGLEASVPPAEPIKAKEEPVPASEPDRDLEFEAANTEEDASYSEISMETPIDAPVQEQPDEPESEKSVRAAPDIPEPEKMDSAVPGIQEDTIPPAIVESEFAGNVAAALNVGKDIDINIDERPLFSEPLSSSESGQKRSGGILLKKYAVMAGGIALLAVLIGFAAYMIYGRSGSGENPGSLETVMPQTASGEQFSAAAPAPDDLNTVPAMPPILQDQVESVSAATSGSDISKPLEKIPSEQPSETPVQASGNNTAGRVKPVPKTQPKESRGAQQGEKTAAKATTKAPSSQYAAVSANAESTADIRKDTDGNTRNAQQETGRLETQAKSDPAQVTGPGTLETEKITAGESTNGTDSAVKSAGKVMELQAGIAPTWDSIAALAPGDVAANFGNSASEIKSAPLKTETPGVVIKGYTPPVLVSKVNPSYPKIAAQIRKTGMVTLKLDINEQGRVVHVEPINGPDVFYDEAIQAALQWRYRPAARDGRSTESQITVSINFNIE